MATSSSAPAPGPAAAGASTATIVETLTRAIVDHRLQPGTKLVEQKIADHFGVSRTLVRQGLFQLAQNRLVTLEPARGAFVATPSVTEARQVFAVRRMLEGEMARTFARSATAKSIKALRAHVAQEQAALKRADVGGRTTLLGDFHVRMAELMGNEVLAQILDDLLSRCALITVMYQTASAAAHSHEEHARIVDALADRDEERAVQLMQAHLQHVEEGLALHPKARVSDLSAALNLHPLMTYDATLPYPRDLAGYGRNPPHSQWPGQARVAVQFVLNYEEGGENSVLHGDAASEQFLSEMFNPAAYPERHMSMEGIYEYGSRAGVWRLLREFEKRGLPLTVFGVATALQRSPDVTQAFVELGHEIACHGLKWIHYQGVPAEVERAHMQQAMDIFQSLFSSRTEHGAGWYTGRDSPNTRRLVADFGGFAYDSDYYGDDLPFWMKVPKSDGSTAPQLIVPYTLDCNDMRFALPQGYSYADPFFQYLKDTFDVLYAEGDPAGDNAPKMMSIGMHCRLLGRPGRITALQRFLDHIQSHDQVWICRRLDLARHWAHTHPYKD